MGWKTNQEDWRRGPAWLCTFFILGIGIICSISPQRSIYSPRLQLSFHASTIWFISLQRLDVFCICLLTQHRNGRNPFRRGPAAPSRPRLCTFITCGREIVCSIFLCGRGLQPAKRSSKWLWGFYSHPSHLLFRLPFTIFSICLLTHHSNLLTHQQAMEGFHPSNKLSASWEDE